MSDSSPPVIELTRRETFSAAHRLWSERLTPEQNWEIYGPCTYEYGHGHNYVLEVTLRGPVDPATGMLINASRVSEALRELIVDEVDHRHLNHDVPMCRGLNPTAENLVVVFWNILHAHFGRLLHEVRLRETEKNWVIYRGQS